MLIDFRKLFPKYGIAPTGVLHVGANIGEEAPVYDELGIKGVFWIEANSQLIPQLRINTYDKYKHKVMHALVGDVEGLEVELHISNNAGQSSSILELGTHKIAHPEVHYVGSEVMKMVRLDQHGCWGGYDFLNIDVQGAELKVLKGMGDLLHQFKWAYLEVNWEPLYKDCALFGEIEEYMARFGFRVAEYKKCGSTGWGDCLFVRA
jgi:FkbM family methyltransferase